MEARELARDLIMTADQIARSQGLTQAQWSKRAGRAENGQTVSRLLTRGECKLSTIIALLQPLGYTLELVKEDANEPA